MGYRRPGCKGDFEEEERLFDHFGVRNDCAGLTDIFLREKLGTALAELVAQRKKKGYGEKDMRCPIDVIMSELKLAEQKHPGFPGDPIHMAAIMAEEAGESLQAAIDLTYNNGDLAKLIREVAQTGAMAIRVLMNLGVKDEEKKEG